MDDTRLPHQAMPGQKRVEPVDARSATKKGNTQTVLIVGTLLVVVLFALLYFIYFA
jgi:hypothetical protein